VVLTHGLQLLCEDRYWCASGPSDAAERVLTTHAAATGAGGFGQRDLFSNMVILQAFNGCVALTALLLAALMHQRDRARREVEQACARLSELVTHLDAALRARRELDTRRVESVRADRSEE
jgi:hypothetical protein